VGGDNFKGMQEETAAQAGHVLVEGAKDAQVDFPLLLRDTQVSAGLRLWTRFMRTDS
jgi:hypothetical protein